MSQPIRTPQAPGYIRAELMPGRAARIFISGLITRSSWWADEGEAITSLGFRRELEALGDVQELHIHVNSPGGDLHEAAAICAALDRHPARKVGHVEGLAASAATLVLMCCDEIRISELGEMMIHPPWAWHSGDAKDFALVADRLMSGGEAMCSLYRRRPAHASLTGDQLLAVGEQWFSAAQAVAAGWADVVETPSAPETQIFAALAGADCAQAIARFERVPKRITALCAGNEAPAHAPGWFTLLTQPIFAALRGGNVPAPAATEHPPASPPTPTAASLGDSEILAIRRRVAPAERDLAMQVLAALSPELRAAQVVQLERRPVLSWARSDAQAATSAVLEPLRTHLPPAVLEPARALLERVNLEAAAGPDVDLLEPPAAPVTAMVAQLLAAIPASALLGADIAGQDPVAPTPSEDPRTPEVRALHQQAGLTDERFMQLKAQGHI